MSDFPVRVKVFTFVGTCTWNAYFLCLLYRNRLPNTNVSDLV